MFGAGLMDKGFAVAWTRWLPAAGRTLAAVAVAASVAGCTPGGPIRTESYWGATMHRFSRGAVYDWWVDEESVARQQRAEGLHHVIRETIDRRLAKMKYQRAVVGAEPHFLVSYRAGSGLQPSESGPQNLALLTIEVVSPDGRLVWRGWAEGSVDASLSPEDRTKRIEHAVRDVLKPFKPD